jgi:hypothetical protein
MVWLGCSSTTVESLNIFSDDGVAGDALAADEEEDGIITYCRRRRVVCLIRARSPVEKEQRGQASRSKTRVFQRELEQVKSLDQTRLFIGTERRLGKPTVPQ